MIRCGLRATDACTLPFDCLLYDGQQAAYLRYFNNKMRREAAVPIDEDLENEIRAQQQRVSTAGRASIRHLFPAVTRNAGGRNPMTYYSYRGMLNSWLTTCEVHDEHGQPAHLTPHQWRHTFACRLINRDVPQEVIRVLLDHESTQMTAHYARITDQTVRRRWEAATKVNIKGERVAIDPEGPLAQAQWAKTRYGMATQTLPNGYCGLPLQRTCPHANACLTCPVFLTGPEFLPELREQQRRTLTLIDVSERGGQVRMVEMNQQVLTNLDRMISEVEKTATETRTPRMRADNSHHIVAAARRRATATRRRATAALRRMDNAGQPISFDAVAREAKVSRSWLYNQPDLRAEIERLRDRRNPAPAAATPSRPATRIRRIAAAATRGCRNEIANWRPRIGNYARRSRLRSANSGSGPHRRARDTPAKKSRTSHRTLTTASGRLHHPVTGVRRAWWRPYHLDVPRVRSDGVRAAVVPSLQCVGWPCGSKDLESLLSTT